MSRNTIQDNSQESPIQESPVSDLASDIKEELRLITIYIRSCLPQLSHIIMHDITVTSHFNSLSFISQMGLPSHIPYKLLIVLKPDYKEDGSYLTKFSTGINSFCRLEELIYTPSFTIIGEKEFVASMRMENNMIANSVGRGRVIVDIEVEKDWIWND